MCWKIFNIAIGNTLKILADDYTEVNQANCIVTKGVQYVDNEWLRQLVLANYPDKVKNGIFFITRTALYHFASKVGLLLLGSNIVNV